jgi:predicted RNase H-like nuclease (RuvC/YqgF family)
LAVGQDAQSVADAARQARLQKQQKDAQAQSAASSTDPQAAKVPRVVTNEEIPEQVESTLTTAHGQAEEPAYSSPSNGTRRNSVGQWKSRIQAQKSAIASLRREISSLRDSIHFPVNCLPNTCAQRNERQLNKESRVETLNHQLEQQQKRLEELQESARKQGFGSAVYDP